MSSNSQAQKLFAHNLMFHCQAKSPKPKFNPNLKLHQAQGKKLTSNESVDDAFKPKSKNTSTGSFLNFNVGFLFCIEVVVSLEICSLSSILVCKFKPYLK